LGPLWVAFRGDRRRAAQVRLVRARPVEVGKAPPGRPGGPYRPRRDLCGRPAEGRLALLVDVLVVAHVDGGGQIARAAPHHRADAWLIGRPDHGGARAVGEDSSEERRVGEDWRLETNTAQLTQLLDA